MSSYRGPFHELSPSDQADIASWTESDPQVDLSATLGPSFVTIQPQSTEAMDWLEENVPDATLYGTALLCEHRYAPDLLLGAHNDGLVVSIDGRIADAPRPGETDQ